MEITDYLRIIKRRLWILLLIPLLAAGAVTAFVLSQPTTYAATATVLAPALIGGSATNQYGGSNGTRAFVSNFAATATTGHIVDQVASETGVSAKQIIDGTTIVGVGDSSVIKVRCELTNKTAASAVGKAIASDTIRYLFQTQVELADGTRAGAQRTLGAAEKALSDFERTNGVQLDQSYTQLQQFLYQLQQQQVSLQANGNTMGAAVVAAKIAQVRTQLSTLQPKVAQYQTLLDRKSRAAGQLTTASQATDSANAQFSAADPTKAVTIGAAQRMSRVAAIAKSAIPAAAGGLFLAVCIIAVLEFARSRAAIRATALPQPQRRESLRTEV